MQIPIKIGEIIELDIEDLTSTGEGLGSCHGFKIFVEGALPLEKVVAEVINLKSNYGIARLCKILKSSPDRVVSPCPFFDRCGGCQIMHLSYEHQLQIKRKRVFDALTRIGKLPLEQLPDITPSEPSLGYRNKIQLPIVQDDEGKIKIGLYAKRSHEVVPIDRCLIHSPVGDEIYRQSLEILKTIEIKAYDEKTHQGELRHLLIRTAVVSGQVLIVLVTTQRASPQIKHLAERLHQLKGVKGVIHHKNSRRGNAIFDEHFTLLYGQSYIEEEICGISFKISAASFFQINPYQATRLYQQALDLAQLSHESHVVDAYCGIGTLSLLIAKHVQHVIGIECVAQAINDAKQNALTNQVHNIEFICGKTEDVIEKMGTPDCVFLNPPRGGCNEKVLKTLGRLAPKTIIYISCDPATLARDAQILISQGFIRHEVMTFDMFPQTMHVETLMRFVR